MDTKNLIFAISLSAFVIIIYSIFWGPSPEEIKQNKINQEQIKKEQTQKSSDTPSLDQNENFSKQSRKEALAEEERIEFENNNVIGTINTVGATIDDLTFKQYNTELNSNKKVTLLNPRKVENGYLIESGFVTSNKNIDVPNASTKWDIVGNKKLTDKNHKTMVFSNSHLNAELLAMQAKKQKINIKVHRAGLMANYRMSVEKQFKEGSSNSGKLYEVDSVSKKDWYLRWWEREHVDQAKIDNIIIN